MEILLYIYYRHEGELLVHLGKNIFKTYIKIFTTVIKFYFGTQNIIYRLPNLYQIPLMSSPKASCLLVAV